MFDPQDENVGEWGGSLFPSDGTHIAVVDRAEGKLSQSSGNPMVVVEFIITGKEDPDRGKMVMYQYYTLVGKGAAKYRQLCLSIDPKMPRHDPMNRSEIKSLIEGKPLAITTKVVNETYQGEERPRVRTVSHRELTPKERNGSGDRNVIPVADDDVPF